MGWRLCKWLIVGTLVAASAVPPANAQHLSNAQREAAAAFTLNNTFHVLLHEIGHLFVDQFDLPVLGREEDAVDAMATLVVLETMGDAAPEVLADVIDGWQASENSRAVRGYVNSDFYGEHSLDIQRSFAIACLMAGSDFETYSAIATRVGLPIDRQESCADDFALAASGWSRLLEPHRRDSGFGAAVEVGYLDHARRFDDIAGILKQDGILERAADWVVKTHALPHPMLITAEECGQVNAFYYPSDGHILLCYEWAEFFYDTFVSEIMEKREHFAAMRKLKSEKLY